MPRVFPLKQLLNFLGLSSEKAANPALSRTAGRPSRALIQEAIENVVEGTEPGIRLVSGYGKKLQHGVAASLAYLDELVETIPGLVETSSKTFAKDPQVNAYFASSSELRSIFSQSPELRAFFNDVENNQCQEAYALLCMDESERTVLGTELSGDMIRREVMQTAVNFSEHKILSPATSEASVRQGLKKCIFDALITRALQSIAALKVQKSELKDQRRILNARLRARLSQGNGLSTLLAAAHVDQTGLKVIEEQLAETEQTLKQMPASSNAPLAYLNEVNNILAHPEAFIKLKMVSLKLTKMCIKATEETSQACNSIRFAELDIANVLRRVVVIVRFPRDEMLPRQDTISG